MLGIPSIFDGMVQLYVARVNGTLTGKESGNKVNEHICGVGAEIINLERSGDTLDVPDERLENIMRSDAICPECVPHKILRAYKSSHECSDLKALHSNSKWLGLVGVGLVRYIKTFYLPKVVIRRADNVAFSNTMGILKRHSAHMFMESSVTCGKGLGIDFNLNLKLSPTEALCHMFLSSMIMSVTLVRCNVRELKFQMAQNATAIYFPNLIMIDQEKEVMYCATILNQQRGTRNDDLDDLTRIMPVLQFDLGEKFPNLECLYPTIVQTLEAIFTKAMRNDHFAKHVGLYEIINMSRTTEDIRSSIEKISPSFSWITRGCK